ncbi:Collagen alpha-1(VIII) chain [Dissostichus eleginoides]|uniref:Collagen alpha-1(VIII) chain n=1 Tax=Dissostichus eleginoides TaxID=100907 RepID=A0AAD9FFQ6_DISEL|nr:Collagen alpha-1(VIII) chain [Dissostichus eleginoides]
MEMTVCFPLLLLICSLSTAQLQSDNEILPHPAESQGGEPTNVSEHQQTCPQDIHAVLREMSASLAEQRVEMRHLQRENEVQAAELITVKARSNVTENQVEALKRDGEVKQNGENVCTAYEHQPSGAGSSANGATLLLEVGDVVFLRLWQNTQIYDNEHHPSTFSGHLLFTM